MRGRGIMMGVDMKHSDLRDNLCIPTAGLGMRGVST